MCWEWHWAPLMGNPQKPAWLGTCLHGTEPAGTVEPGKLGQISWEVLGYGGVKNARTQSWVGLVVLGLDNGLGTTRVSLAVLGQSGGSGVPRHSNVLELGPLTTELLLEELEELCPAQGVVDELTEVEAPALHTQLRGGCHSVGDSGIGAGSPWQPA